MSAYAVIGAVAGAGVVLLIGTTAYCVFSGKTNKTADIFIPSETFEAHENPIWKKSEVECQESLENLAGVVQSLKVYSFTELQSATDDFSPSCLITGSVYRGRINGDFAIIKRMKRDVSKEINLLDTDDQKFLSWTQRIQIALDVAKGLNYIHSLFSPPHVHKEIKSGNILLDGDCRAKITNFSLTQSQENKDGQFITSEVIPMKNHQSPEFLENGVITPKLDVFAFGILVLEMLTGKEVAVLYETVNMHLSEVLVAVLHEEDVQKSLPSLMYPSLEGNYPSDLAISVARLIDHCLQKDPSSRPTMDEIVRSLSKVLTASLSWESSI
ncbi:lysM domain receptor-like kinase 4 [Ancistrocladus abbreviatus]